MASAGCASPCLNARARACSLALTSSFPLPLCVQYPDADILSSSDHLLNTATDEGLEKWPDASSAANIGIMLFRPKGHDLAAVRTARGAAYQPSARTPPAIGLLYISAAPPAPPTPPPCWRRMRAAGGLPRLV